MKQKVLSFIPPILIFLISLAVYFKTASPFITFGDSAEYVFIAQIKGIAHPPGYPLYTLLAIVSSLLPIGTAAFRVNFLSGILNSLTLLVVYQIIKKITAQKIPSFIASLALAFSPLFWTYSTVAEVFPLNNLLFSLLILSSLLFNLPIFGLILGLSLTNHYTIILSLPAFAVFFYLNKNRLKISRKKIFITIFAFALGLLPILYLVIAASRDPLYNFGDPRNLANLIKVLTREMYSFVKEAGLGPYKINPTNLFPKYLQSILENFHLFLLFLLPAFYYLRSNRKLASLLGLLFFLTGPLFLLIFKIEITNNTTYAVVQRFYLMSLILIPIIIGLGIAFSIKIISNSALRITFIILLITLTLIPLNTNYQKIDQSKNDLYPKFGHFIMDTLPQNSTFINTADYSFIIVPYLQIVENYRKDIIAISPSLLKYEWYRHQLENQYKDQNLHFEGIPNSLNSGIFAQMLCKIFAPNTQVFLETQSDQYNPKTLQCPLIKYGLVWKVLPHDSKVASQEIMKTTDTLYSSYKLDNLDPKNYPQDLHTKMLWFQLSGLVYNYNLYFQKELENQPEKAEQIDRLAVKFSDHGPSLNSLATITLMKGDPKAAEQLLKTSIASMPTFAPSYFNLAGIYKTVYKDNAKAEELYRKYLDLSPKASPQEKDLIESLIKSR